MLFFSDELPVTQNHLVATIPSWGPSYRVSLSFYVNSLIVPGLKAGYSELLSFTASEQLNAIGYRIPAIFIGSGGGMGIGTQIGTDGNAWAPYSLAEKTWYNLELSQFREDNKVKNSLTNCTKEFFNAISISKVGHVSHSQSHYYF